MTIYYLACIDYLHIGIAIKKIEFVKKINENYISGKFEIIWKYGNYGFEEKGKSFFKLNNLKPSLEKAVEDSYLHIEKLMVILVNRKSETIQNVKIAEEILDAEKRTAKETSRELKIATNIFKNLDIRKQLEWSGLIDY